MATLLYPSAVASDLSATQRTLTTVPEGASSLTVTAPNGGNNSYWFYSNAHAPSNADWENTTITVKVEVTTADSNLELLVTCHRVNSSGVSQDSWTGTAEQTLSATGSYTFNVATKDMATGACGDRIRFQYNIRSTKAHGGDASAVLELGTTNAEVSFDSLTQYTGTCYGAFTRDEEQFATDHTTKVATGGTLATDEGITNPVYLDGRVASYQSSEDLTMKVEHEATGTAFNDVASSTGDIMPYNPDTPSVRRSNVMVYDTTNDQFVMFGGWDGTTNNNEVWVLSMAQKWSPQPQWRQLTPSGTAPSARRLASAVYHEAGNRMILFGGYDTADNNDVYALDMTAGSEAWSTLSPTGTAPLVRSNTRGNIDQTNELAYFFGGFGASRYNDVWELDLTTTNGAWTELKATGTAGNPSERSDPCTILDETNGRLIVFSGYNGTARLNDVWEFDIATTTFTELTGVSGTAPSIRELAMAVYDPDNGRMLIHGGRVGTASADYREDLWELDLTDGTEAWTDRSDVVDERASGVASAGMAWDPLNKLFCVACGIDSSVENTKHTLAFDCTSAVVISGQLVLNNHLRGRDAMGYAYNPDRNEGLIIGGYARINSDNLVDGEHTNEMWIYDFANDEWYNPIVDTMMGFANREGATAVYDTNRNRFIIFGGLTGNNTSNNVFYNDTWELKADADGIYRLTRLAPTGTKPEARWLQASVYDEDNDRMVMFGGDHAGTYDNDLWELDFAGSADGAWLELTPTGTVPSGKRQPAYWYDKTNGRMHILCGGTGVSSFVNEHDYVSLATQGSEAWVTRATGPDARRGMTCRYDEALGKVICFGGYDGTNHKNDTWVFNTAGNSFGSVLTPTTSPTTRRSHACFLDPTNDRYIVFGGREADALSFNTRANTWEFDFSDANEANWDWAQLDPKIYINASIGVTGLTTATDYHWQEWVTGTITGDSIGTSYGGNAESVADFSTAGAVVSNILSINGAVLANIASVDGVAKANISSINTVTA
ncbi:MAG: hypothetical protein KAT71_08085 [Gammaproteobacteria bacterium]|nr:hypothetical protein [Gammaproteobacteria bacterium]